MAEKVQGLYRKLYQNKLEEFRNNTKLHTNRWRNGDKRNPNESFWRKRIEKEMEPKNNKFGEMTSQSLPACFSGT